MVRLLSRVPWGSAACRSGSGRGGAGSGSMHTVLTHLERSCGCCAGTPRVGTVLLIAPPCQDALAVSGRRCRLQTVRESLRDLLRVAGPFWTAFDVLSWRSKRFSVGFEMAGGGLKVFEGF